MKTEINMYARYQLYMKDEETGKMNRVSVISDEGFSIELDIHGDIAYKSIIRTKHRINE